MSDLPPRLRRDRAPRRGRRARAGTPRRGAPVRVIDDPACLVLAVPDSTTGACPATTA
jgi:hypothetical protein